MTETTEPETALYIAGALIRRHLRALFDLYGLTYIEYKGWMESSFTVTGSLDQHARVRRAAEQMGLV